MKPTSLPEALFYPFHLCHEETLSKLLLRFSRVHFRDFMSLQFTPMAGMTAYPDRMGDRHPELVASGTLVQGYAVSGPLPSDVEAAIDRDLHDAIWKNLFHCALRDDRRFQTGLFGTEPVLHLLEDNQPSTYYSVARVKQLCGRTTGDERTLDYGLALVKTSAALVYTFRLALTHGLQAATDSPAHFALFAHALARDGLAVGNHLIIRKGY